MRFGTIGTGAMGGLIAGYLSANGEDVRCFDADPRVVDAIDRDGLRVERAGRDDLVVRPAVSTSAEELGTVDVAFVLTKAMDTEDALADAEPIIGPETTVVTVQNGLGNVENVERHVPPENVLGGCTRRGSNTVRPGHVRELTRGKTVFGGPDAETAARVAAALDDAGLEALAVEDPTPYIWDKQFLNVAIKPVAALTGVRNGPMIEYEETRWAMRQLVEEAVAVARAEGVEILSDDPVDDAINRDIGDGYEKKSSILEDVENERPTEIHYINGAVAELGAEHGVDTPYNRIVTQLVAGKQRAYLD